MKLNDLLNELDSIALSEAEFKRVANCNSFLLFTDLANYNSLEQLFQVNGDKILLALKSTPNFAHFMCLCKQNNNKCIYYESYGKSVEQLIKESPYTMDKSRGINLLKRLENNSKISIDYNRYVHQKNHIKNNNPINTCGFHSSNRIRYSHLSNQQYDAFIKSTNMDADWFVILTNLNTILDMSMV
jgi:hypothetical protein